MKFAEHEVRQIASETWRIVLDEELEPSTARIAPGQIIDSIAACAQITGDWQLAVVLYCSTTVARHVAGIMFGDDDGTRTAEDVNDAMCEMINIITGNVKGVLSGSSHLSLPNLVKGQDFKLLFPRHILLSEAHFTYRAEPVLVILLGEDKIAARIESGSANRPVRPWANGAGEG